jgi:serine/threonine protein kinase
MKYCPACQRAYEKGERFCLIDSARLSLKDPYQLVGRTLDNKYRIDALIGVGGMGAVYCALHLGIERPAAFKILLPHLILNNEKIVELFEGEAKR